MYIVRFHGGLGNQICEYIFYRYFEELLKKRDPDAVLRADLTWFERNCKVHQGYELERVFGIRLPAADYAEIARVHEYYPRYHKLMPLRVLSRKFAAMKNAHNKPTGEHIYDFGESCYRYNPIYESLDTDKDWYIEGVFCTDEYLDRIKDVVLKELVFVPADNDEDIEILDRMGREESVALHVRRGDYSGTVFDVVTVDYYKRAVEYIRERVKDPVFYVFSDDVEYIDKNFAFLGDRRMIHHSGKSSFRDMQFISGCKHKIIANSTFSFCAAMLGEAEDGIIIAPAKYKADEDIVMAREHWVKL